MKTRIGGCGIACIIGILGVSSANASSERVLYSLPQNALAFDRVLADKHGNLYATTYADQSYGSVLKLTAGGGVVVLSQFQGGADGQNPVGGLTQDNASALFGTTVFGGASGAGTIYKIPSGGQRTVVYNFGGTTDGSEPESTLLFDKALGVFYGTTALGGNNNCGTVFKLSPSGGSWALTTLYRFNGGSDGCGPERSLHFGRKVGILYGSTERGGPANHGTIFSLTQKSGIWQEDILYDFKGGGDGSRPTDVTVDLDGTIYGVAESGGAFRHGVVFSLAKVNGQWNEAVLYNFQKRTDGARPIGLHMDQNFGVLYVTTETGGQFGGGTVFKIFKNGTSPAVLHHFGVSGDGSQPRARVTQDNRRGVLYGTTEYGGVFGSGTIYEIVL
jgi:uncharacterized repeat protein (TIGR03803 family)